MRRLLLVAPILVLFGCREGSPVEGAVKLTVSYSGFKPGCVRVIARDVAGAGETFTDVAGEGEVTGGSITVAIFRGDGWGSEFEVEAQAFERACPPSPMGSPVVRTSGSITLVPGQPTPLELSMTARDSDGDGFVTTADNGSDCDDSEEQIFPDAPELCNGRDDNCVSGADEGFSVGTTCDATGGCHGALTCTLDGKGIECLRIPNQWRPDVDQDGKGDRNVAGMDACLQPAGYVANDLDCDDSDRTRYFAAPELCDNKDNDCDLESDEGLGVDSLCTNASNCSGRNACVADGGVECNAPQPTSWYTDMDTDGYGARNTTAQPFCDPPDAGYSANAEDCDDTDKLRNPMASERCNNLDDDCDDVDDTVELSLGTGCTPDGGCAGQLACDGDGGVYCVVTTPPSFYFPDDDYDSYGRSDAGTTGFCSPTAPPGYSAVSTDCDDGNPFTHPSARELCDVADNDCDGANEDAGVCPGGGPAWLPVSALNIGTLDWYSISLWGDGGVWISGENQNRAVKRPENPSFDTVLNAGNCNKDWYSVWADPLTGRAYLGANDGRVTFNDLGSTSCASLQDSQLGPVHGMVGLSGEAGLEIHGVGVENSTTKRTFVWDGGTGVRLGTTPVSELYDVHGLSRNVLFAVGGPATGARIFRMDSGTGEWQSENIESTLPDAGTLDGVWVVNDKLAYAVGTNGTVLRWDGTSWNLLPFHNSSDKLTSVIAFGLNSVYVTAANGSVYRYNGSTWEIVARITPNLNDIAGTSPEDLWVVGADGVVVHWPK